MQAVQSCVSVRPSVRHVRAAPILPHPQLQGSSRFGGLKILGQKKIFSSFLADCRCEEEEKAVFI